MHCYFVAPTKYNEDIRYKVQRIKAGKSFCSLTVDSRQGGNITSKFMVSFDKPESPNSNLLDFTTREMPAVPRPDSFNDPVEPEGLNTFHFDEYSGSAYSFPGLDIYMCLTVKEMEDYAAKRSIDAK